MDPRAPILIVEDYVPLASAFARLLAGRAPARIAVTVRDARAEFQSANELSAAIIDVSLPDGSGLDVLQEARARFPRLPVLVVTGSCERTVINRAHLLRAEFACKPEEFENVRAFVDRVLGGTNQPYSLEARLEECIALRRRAFLLSPRELDVLRLEVAEVSRKQMAASLCISKDAVKRIVRSIAEKADGAPLAEIARQIRSELMKRAR